MVTLEYIWKSMLQQNVFDIAINERTTRIKTKRSLLSEIYIATDYEYLSRLNLAGAGP